MAIRDPDLVVRLPGPPRGKGRPRMRVITPKAGRSFAGVYTDAQTRNYEGMLRQVAAVAMGSRPLLSGPLMVTVRALFPVPASWSRRKRSDALGGLLRPTGKPDADNLMKVIDSCNGIVWNDDSQVVDMRVIKRYSEKPSLAIFVWTIVRENISLLPLEKSA